jgi:hypothetical protein
MFTKLLHSQLQETNLAFSHAPHETPRKAAQRHHRHLHHRLQIKPIDVIRGHLPEMEEENRQVSDPKRR